MVRNFEALTRDEKKRVPKEAYQRATAYMATLSPQPAQATAATAPKTQPATPISDKGDTTRAREDNQAATVVDNESKTSQGVHPRQ